MGSSDGKNNSEINGNLAALLASREKQDLLFSTQSQPKVPISQAIIVKKTIAKSDIDIVLEGDF